jgi:uncharacterized protein
MPVRSLNSSVLRWPDRGRVDRAVRAWAEDAVMRHGRVLKLGYFGSYARGDWGVGSDLDLVAILETDPEPFERRSLKWDLNQLPVQAQLLVYTAAEWGALKSQGSRFFNVLNSETVWVFDKPDVEEGNG